MTEQNKNKPSEPLFEVIVLTAVIAFVCGFIVKSFVSVDTQEYEVLKAQFEQYKEKMKPYEEQQRKDFEEKKAIPFDTTEIISQAGAEPNTSDAEMALYNKAKENAETATYADIKEAVRYIRDNKDNLFKDNDTMEKSIYYGYLLENSTLSSENISDLGWKTAAAIKYVYRHVETPADREIKLKQINELLEKIDLE